MIARQGAEIRIIRWWKVMSLCAYRGPPTRPGTGWAQVRWLSGGVALEKMVLGEKTAEDSMVLSMNESIGGAMVG